MTTTALMGLQDRRQEGRNSHLLEPSRYYVGHFMYVYLICHNIYLSLIFYYVKF